MNKLFSEISIKNLQIKNRVVLPPMVIFGLSGDNGFVTEGNIRHYESIAKGGAGLVILEAHAVNKNGRLAPEQLGLWSDDHIDGLAKIGEACHKHDAAVLVQIHHAGMKTPVSVAEIAYAPSECDDAKRKTSALSVEDIRSIQKDFSDAAIRAEKAGLDGVELHGAHGYLISQFMSPVTNKRTDEYGGSITNRARFACEIIEKIKNKTGSDFITGYRMGGNEPTLENGILIAEELEKSGIDLLHVSSGISSGETPAIPENLPYNWIVYNGTEIKKHVHIPVIVVNGIITPSQASYIIENQLADFTAIGRGFLTDPEWADKAREGREINLCRQCRRCWWFVNKEKCPGRK